MKKVLMCCLMGLFSLGINAQSINGVELSEIESPYMLIMGVQKVFGPTVTIQVDFGQFGASRTFKKAEEVRILDEQKKMVEFNSMVDALNFFSKYGYEFVDAYAVTVPSGLNGSQSVYHWLLKRKESMPNR